MHNIHLKLVLVPVFPLKRSQMKWVSCELPVSFTTGLLDGLSVMRSHSLFLVF